MRAPAAAENQPLFEYTHMPAHMRGPFTVEELQHIQLAEPFAWTKGCRTMKIPAPEQWLDAREFGTLLFDLAADPAQEHPITDPDIEVRMTDHLLRLMRENEAPTEQYERLGLQQEAVPAILPARSD